MKIKRILWLAGSPSTYMRELHQRLENTGYDIQFVYFPVSVYHANQRLYEEGTGSLRAVWYDSKYKNRLHELVEQYAKDPKSAIVCYGTAPRIIAWIAIKIRHSKCKKIFFSDNNIAIMCRKSIVSTAIRRWFLSHFDAILCIGKANYLYYHYVLDQSSVNRMEFIHFPYPHQIDQFSSSLKSCTADTGPVRFLYLGRLVPEKNLQALVGACKLLLQKGITDYQVTIAGGGVEENRLMAFVAANDLKANVTFLGQIKTSQRTELFEQHHVFVLPSTVEPWGLVVNEALSAGLPLIVPVWVGAAVDLILDNFNGKLLFHNNANAVAEAMEYYITRREAIESHSRNTSLLVHAARKTIDESYNAIQGLFGTT